MPGGGFFGGGGGGGGGALEESLPNLMKLSASALRMSFGSGGSVAGGFAFDRAWPPFVGGGGSPLAPGAPGGGGPTAFRGASGGSGSAPGPAAPGTVKNIFDTGGGVFGGFGAMPIGLDGGGGAPFPVSNLAAGSAGNDGKLSPKGPVFDEGEVPKLPEAVR